MSTVTQNTEQSLAKQVVSLRCQLAVVKQAIKDRDDLIKRLEQDVKVNAHAAEMNKRLWVPLQKVIAAAESEGLAMSAVSELINAVHGTGAKS